MEYVSVPGRRVLSRPGQNDGLIRSWLSRQGWRAPTHVKNGVVWVGDAARADYLTTLMARRWDEVIPQPTVGIWEEVPRAASAG
jgi:hypothetical protein